MAELRVELNITVADKPFMSDTAIINWIMIHLETHSMTPAIKIDSVRLVGPRRNG